MAAKEAKARIKINNLLEESGWRFFDEKVGRANLVLETNVRPTKEQIDDLGEAFGTTTNGSLTFLCGPIRWRYFRPRRIRGLLICKERLGNYVNRYG